MGMGNSKVWHGSPDGLCDITPLTTLRGGGADIDTESGAESDVFSGTKSVIEGKREFSPTDMNQLIGEAVVMSYIHNKRHSNQPGLVPALGLALGNVMVAMYDSTRDILLLLLPTVWFKGEVISKEKSYDLVWLVILWTMLHHQLFVNESVLGQMPDGYKSSLKQQFQAYGVLDIYQELKSDRIAVWPWKQYPPPATTLWKPPETPPPLRKHKGEEQ